MDSEQIRIELNKRADEEYRKLSSGLLPGVSSILGVRLPELRKMAKQMARADWRENLRQLSDDTFEEIMPVLKQNRLDPEVQRKTLQKIIESRTISPKTREKIRAMKK